jgi:hypothetical protein
VGGGGGGDLEAAVGEAAEGEDVGGRDRVRHRRDRSAADEHRGAHKRLRRRRRRRRHCPGWAAGGGRLPVAAAIAGGRRHGGKLEISDLSHISRNSPHLDRRARSVMIRITSGARISYCSRHIFQQPAYLTAAGIARQRQKRSHQRRGSTPLVAVGDPVVSLLKKKCRIPADAGEETCMMEPPMSSNGPVVTDSASAPRDKTCPHRRRREAERLRGAQGCSCSCEQRLEYGLF